MGIYLLRRPSSHHTPQGYTFIESHRFFMDARICFSNCSWSSQCRRKPNPVSKISVPFSYRLNRSVFLRISRWLGMWDLSHRRAPWFTGTFFCNIACSKLQRHPPVTSRRSKFSTPSQPKACWLCTTKHTDKDLPYSYIQASVQSSLHSIQQTHASLRYPLSVFNKDSTLKQIRGSWSTVWRAAAEGVGLKPDAAQTKMSLMIKEVSLSRLLKGSSQCDRDHVQFDVCQYVFGTAFYLKFLQKSTQTPPNESICESTAFQTSQRIKQNPGPKLPHIWVEWHECVSMLK